MNQARVIRFVLQSCVWFSLATAVPIVCLAQDAKLTTVANTSSPRDTLKSFIDSTNEFFAVVEQEKFFDTSDPTQVAIAYRVLDCLDLSQLPAFAREEQAGEIAVCIKEILDRVELPPWDEIPGLEEIESSGDSDSLSRWQIPGTRLNIARVEEGPQKYQYVFSPGSAERAVEYFRSISQEPYREGGPAISEGFYEWYTSAPRSPVLAGIVEQLPDWMRKGKSLGATRWKSLASILAVILSAAAILLCYWRYLQVQTVEMTLVRRWLSLCLLVVAAGIPLLFQYFIEDVVGVRGTPLYVLQFLSFGLFLIGCSLIVFATSTRIADTLLARQSINPLGINAQIVRITTKISALAIVSALILVGGQFLGIPVGTLLASAGIGGVALALGAQDTLKDLFGTMSLMADKPFRVGERIILDGYDGVVEDIGLRSTRLRLLTGHLVTLPNEHLARSNIENVGRRPHIRRTADIHLPLDTPRESLEAAIQIIRDVLEDHVGMDPELPPRVFFTDYLPNAFNIRIIYWYCPPDYWEFLAMSEKVNLAIFDEFESQGIQFSCPTRVAHTSLRSEEKPLAVELRQAQA